MPGPSAGHRLFPGGARGYGGAAGTVAGPGHAVGRLFGRVGEGSVGRRPVTLAVDATTRSRARCAGGRVAVPHVHGADAAASALSRRRQQQDAAAAPGEAARGTTWCAAAPVPALADRGSLGAHRDVDDMGEQGRQPHDRVRGRSGPFRAGRQVAHVDVELRECGSGAGRAPGGPAAGRQDRHVGEVRSPVARQGLSRRAAVHITAAPRAAAPRRRE